MKTQKRRYNGRYMSQKQWERREFRRMKIYALSLLAMAIIGYIGTTRTVEVHIPHVEASNATTTDENLCGLQAVVCEDEQPVVEAIKAVSDALGRDVTDETKKRIAYLYDKATEADVPFRDAVKTVYCESMFVAQKSHLPEESYGIAQIHLPSHKNVTKEQAMDAYFSIDFMVENWEGTKWYGYDRENGTCTNGLTISL